MTQTFSRKIFKLDEHFERLLYSADKMEMPLDFTLEKLKSDLEKVLEQLDTDFAYIRIVVTRGEGEIGLDPALATKNNVIIIVKELPPNPSWWYDDGVHMIISHTMRNPKNAVDPRIKSGNYLNNVMAMHEAKKAGAFDAIMLNAKGEITEATTSNIWIVKDGEVITPPIKAGLLGGITRKSLIQIAKDNKLNISERNFDEDFLKSADECFLTSTTKLLVPITKIDNCLIGDGKPGKYTLQLLDLYKKANHI
ncbi:putative D-alanine aminotransferase [Halobacteriovorax marinus SJ]|uniref:branched-chain-amino-acid transaminase n=1 Tax=Halobacteriovorax marinus (strain ATCC BAA-682 / DSM 15412 / SJ) TaxID=862908 RepID=E1X4C2_HALMS|nr:aminotransferase class IV [Halobacteriovorax marinus]CBW27094.1 putative D-alanine aminotransferase [Halobacteriovorax marinus SJ]